MKKYNLTDEQIKKIARLAVQENGESVVGKEVSLMANLFELQTKYSNIYDYIRNGGWFARAAYHMDNGSASSAAIATTRDVLVNGNRQFPAYINEHDCLSDLTSVSNNGVSFDKNDRTKYKKDVTVIKNRYGSTYTFYEFPTSYSDPFGYTAAAYKKLSGTTTTPTTVTNAKSGYTFSPDLVKNGTQGQSVLVLQTLLKGLSYLGSNGKVLSLDGDAGANTIYALKQYQSKNGLTADGEAGKLTWGKLLGGS